MRELQPSILGTQTGTHACRHVAFPFTLPAHACISWLRAPLWPQNLPSSTEPGSQGSKWVPVSHGTVGVRGTSLWLGLGCVETLDAVTEICSVKSTAATDQAHAPTTPILLLSPGPPGGHLASPNASSSPVSPLGRQVLAKLSAALW